MKESTPTVEVPRASASEADSVAKLIVHGEAVFSVQPSEVGLYRLGVRLTAIAAAILFIAEIAILKIL